MWIYGLLFGSYQSVAQMYSYSVSADNSHFCHADLLILLRFLETLFLLKLWRFCQSETPDRQGLGTSSISSILYFWGLSSLSWGPFECQVFPEEIIWLFDGEGVQLSVSMVSEESLHYLCSLTALWWYSS